MRKLIVANFMSLDGYFEGPDHDVMALPFDPMFDSTTWSGCAPPTPCCWNGSAATQADTDAAPRTQDWFSWVDGLGAWRAGNRLRPPDAARTVRVRNGEVQVSNGPFSHAKEWIAGFDLIECADFDEAVEIASKHPNAYTGQLELRPIWPLDEE